jgi:hypothetical protein
MRLATYNVEWFANLFDDEGLLLADDGWSGRQDVRRRDQAEALGIVFTALDADAVMVIEAPDGSRRRSGTKALETFAATFGLRQRQAVMGFLSDTQQEIALLFDPDRMSAFHDPRGGTPGEGGVPRFDESFRIDLDIDAKPEKVTWSKPPLELAVTTASGAALRLIGVHAKSKAPHGAVGHVAIMRAAIENRRKQLAQCIWLRRRVEEHLAAGEALIVMGDFNDGPGLDEYEKLFGRSGVEVVMGEEGGEEGQQRLFDPNALEAMARHFTARSTARFFLADEGRWLSALLDYIMISPDLLDKGPVWRIWHPFDDPVCYQTPELREALLTASDHFPVSLDIDL